MPVYYVHCLCIKMECLETLQLHRVLTEQLPIIYGLLSTE